MCRCRDDPRSHITPLARSYIEKADVVFTALSDGIIELWLQRMNSNVRSFQSLYKEGKSRAETYREMIDTMLIEVRAGRRICGAFYGHPGVFALPPHKAIAAARAEGYPAHMEPGVSAEDCLYADLRLRSRPLWLPTLRGEPVHVLPSARGSVRVSGALTNRCCRRPVVRTVFYGVLPPGTR